MASWSRRASAIILVAFCCPFVARTHGPFAGRHPITADSTVIAGGRSRYFQEYISVDEKLGRLFFGRHARHGPEMAMIS
jgi:hypothetical protein